MKTKQSKVTRRITMALSLVMLAEQLAGTGAVLYAHAEDEVKTEYSIEQSVSASWEGGYNANIVLTNLAEKDTQDWSITFCTSDKITNLWGGTITECLEVTSDIEEEEDAEEEIVEIWIDDYIPVDDGTDDTQAETKDVEAETLENGTDVDTEKEADDEKALEAAAENTAEETEKEYEVETTVEAVEDVTVESQEFDYDAPAVEEIEVYYQYTVKAMDHNAVIAAGASVTIGYNAEGNDYSFWNEKAQLTFKEDKSSSIPVGGTYEYDGYTVEVKIPSYWGGAYNVRLLITNTSDETLHNWAFVMDTKDTISGLYNAVEVTKDSDKENVHLIKNAGYNQDIPAGGTVEVGYTAYFEGDVDVPDDFALSQIETEVTTAECEVSLFISDEWENGGLAQLVIKNISQLPIEDWMIEFDSALDIKEIWGGVIESHEGEHYFIRNSGYAQNILPGESWTVGILFGGESAEINNVQVKQIVAGSMNNADGILSVCTDQMTINEDGNYEFTEDFEKFTGTLARINEVTKFAMQVYDKNDIKIYETDIDPAADWELEDFAFIYGLDRFVFEVYFGAERYEVELIVDCKSNHNFDKLELDMDDNDGDGLANYYEKYFGTDENDVDTDDDELTDYQELYELGYNPLDPDTDADGTFDKDEDEDEDGISNKEEYELGSDPLSMDSDKDKLLDSIEITYGTSLILVDTDNDGITDYEEYMLDQINATYDSANGLYTADFSADTMGIVYDKAAVPSISLTGDEAAIMNFSINMVESSCMLNPSMVGYMGQAYEFTTDGNMAGAELTFTYDESKINVDVNDQNEFYPAIYYYNPDDDTFTEVSNQTWVGNKVSAHLDHFSLYAVANKAQLEKYWNRSVDTILAGGANNGMSTSVDDDIKTGTLNLTVTDQDGNPIPYCDVIICESCNSYVNAMGGLLYNSVDSYSFFLKTTTDGTGQLICELPAPKENEYNGCYTVLVDKQNAYGNTATIGNWAWPRCVFSDGIKEGEVYNLNMELVSYGASSEKQHVEFQAYDKEQGTILYSCKATLYKGWGLTSLITPAHQVKQASGGWFTELFGLDVAMGRYTAVIEREGYPKKKLEILVTPNNKPYFIVMDREDNVVEIEETDVEKFVDRNGDKLDDNLTKLICQGKIATITGTFAFAGMKDDANWEQKYSIIMESNDYDGDGLKNGDEIEIYYSHYIPYIKIHTDPELEDSDFDYISDKDELEVYYTNPMMAEGIIYNADHIEVNRFEDFESGKAYDKYLDRDTEEIAAEYIFNAMLCGGESNIIKTARMELLDLFVKNASVEGEAGQASQMLETVGTALRVYSDALDLGFPGEDSIGIIKEMNALQRRVAKIYKQGWRTFDDVKELYHEWKQLDAQLAKNVKFAKNVATVANYSLAAIACGAQMLDDYGQYHEGLEIMDSYENLLIQLMLSKDDNVKEAAYAVSQDMHTLKNGAITSSDLDHLAMDAFNAGGQTALGIFMGKLGPVGLVYEITSFAADIIVGSSLDTYIINFIDVEIANSVSMAVKQNMLDGKTINDKNGNVITVCSRGSRNSVDNLYKLMKLSIYSRIWTESKYIDYLKAPDKLFCDDDYHLYDHDLYKNEEDVINLANEHIATMEEKMSKYTY